MVLLKMQNSRIQAVISEIDEVLNKPSTEISHKITEEILIKSQQVLHETLEYLNQDLDKSSNLQPIDPCLPSEDTINLQIKQSLQKVFFAPIKQYLQEDFAILQEEKQALQEEIRQLQKQRQENYSLAQQYAKQEKIIFEFSQVLLSQIQEIFSEHLPNLANQDLSPAQSVLSSKQHIFPQTMKDIETSEAMQISEDKLEEASKYDQSFIDYSNYDDSEKKNKIRANYIEADINAHNIQIKQLSSEIDESNEQIGESVLPYPGYEFLEREDMKSRTTEIEKKSLQLETLDNQEYFFDYQFSIDENQGLEIPKGYQQENKNFAEVEPPCFKDNYTENQNHQNQFLKIEDEAAITPELKLEPSENREYLDNTEILESLSNLFGKLESNKEKTNQSIDTTEKQQNITNLTNKLEEEKYIHASLTQNLLPIEELEKKPKEFLLSSKTLQCLRSDLESLEEIAVDELIDNFGQTQLELGKEENKNLKENTSVITSEEELTNLEDLFVNINDVSEKLIASNQKNISSLEDILDDLRPETDEEIIETDNQEFLSLETLIQDKTNLEKKIDLMRNGS